MQRAILLDRDGTILVERHYLADPAGVELLPGAAAGLRRLARLGPLVVVTNQSGLARGYFDRVTLEAIHAEMRRKLAAQGVELAAIEVCPHHPDEGCECRKPRPGLALRAAARLGFDPARSIVIGDKACDVDMGRAIGATTILVRTGYGAREEVAGTCRPHLVADDLREAAELALAWDRAAASPALPLRGPDAPGEVLA